MAFSQTHAPRFLQMDKILGAANALGGFAKQCRFVVKIKPTGRAMRAFMNNDLHFMCEAVEYPGRGFDITEVRYYGPSMVFPNNTTYQPISLSFMCRTRSIEREFFDNWMEIINPTSSFNFEYAQNYWGEVEIYQLSEYASANYAPGIPPGVKSLWPGMNIKETTPPEITYMWTLRRAWPMLVMPQQVTWADQDILRLQVQFTYKHWERPDYQSQGQLQR